MKRNSDPDRLAERPPQSRRSQRQLANQHTGTSIPMIERAYMRFIPAALQEKLAAEA